MIVRAVVMLLLFGLAPAALAQPRTAPSERELAYGRRLAARTAREGGKVRPVHAPVDPRSALASASLLDAPLPPDAPQVDAPHGRGIEVDLGDLRVTRLRFESAEDAQRYASRLGALHPCEVVIGELRGDQVVTATGDLLRDAALAQGVRESFWEGLPASPTTDASFTDLGGGNLALSTRLTSGPIRDVVDALHDAGRKSAPGPGYFTIEGDRAIFMARNGHRVLTHIDEHGASVLTATDFDRHLIMKDHLAALDAHPRPRADQGPQAARRGARGALHDAFGD